MKTTKTANNRVAAHTADSVNRKIQIKTDRDLLQYAKDPEKMDDRLRSLEKEWDIERALETSASAFTVIGVLLGAFVNPWWLLLPGIVGVFLFQHAVQGWCPPLPIFRRFGIRTTEEILRERYALRLFRGDFNKFCQSGEGDFLKKLDLVLDTINE